MRKVCGMNAPQLGAVPASNRVPDAVSLVRRYANILVIVIC